MSTKKMLDVSNKFFLCYAWEDRERIKQLVRQIEHDIEVKISVDVPDTKISQLTEEISDRIADSEIFIVFISNAAKLSDFVHQCLLRASHLNKNILPVKIDKRQGLLPGSRSLEFEFRTKIYDYNNHESKVAFLDKLKASLGLYLEDGDSYGALVHIATDCDAQIWRNDQNIGYAMSNNDCRIRLAKGIHQLLIQEAKYPYSHVYITVEIPDNKTEQFINVPLNQLLTEKQEREEREIEVRKKLLAQEEKFRDSMPIDDEDKTFEYVIRFLIIIIIIIIILIFSNL